MSIDFATLGMHPPVSTAELEYALGIPGSVILEDLIRPGRVQIEGRTDTDIAIDLLMRLREFRSGAEVPKVELHFQIDHTPDLLTHARSLRSSDPSIAAVLYALWFEHWLNHVIITVAERRGLNREFATQIIRDLNHRPKTTWLLPLLGLPELPPNVLRSAAEIVEFRNWYVHHKWKAQPIDHFSLDDARRLAIIVAFEDSIPLIEDYSTDVLMDKASILVRRIFAQL